LRRSGEPIGEPDTLAQAGAAHLRKARLLHLGLEPDAIADLKQQLKTDRWARQAYNRRLKEEATASSLSKPEAAT